MYRRRKNAESVVEEEEKEGDDDQDSSELNARPDLVPVSIKKATAHQKTAHNSSCHSRRDRMASDMKSARTPPGTVNTAKSD